MDLDLLRQVEFAASDDGGIFLNSASVGPMPARSVALLSAANRDRTRPAMWPLDRITPLNEARWLAARLIKAAEHEIP